MKLFIRFLIAAILIAAGYYGWQYFNQPQAQIVPRTTPAAIGSVERTVLATGILEANALVNVGAEVSGRINALHVALGQDVKAGDLIAEIDSLAQENAVRTAEAALESAQAQKRIQQANARQAEQTLQRSRQLFEQNLITAAALESAEIDAEIASAQLDQFEAQILQAELSVESANLALASTRILAPVNGTIVAVMVDEGQSVNANADAPTVVKIADLDTMIVKAEISEADVPNVAPGQRVYFTILGDPDTEIGATLLDIEPAPDSITSGSAASGSAIYYNGRFSVPNPDRTLRISMTAQVTIVLEEARDVVIVDAGSVTQSPRGASVRVYDPQSGETELRPVTVGLNNNIAAEIVSGLAEGELVIAAGAASTGGAGARGGAVMGMGGPPGGMFR